MNKHQVESEVARRADGGVIVEIGVGVGNGIVALRNGTELGRMLQIWAVDPFEDYTDLNGAHYGPDTEAGFRQTIDPFKDDIRYMRMKGVEAAQAWNRDIPVALVWVDLTDCLDNLKAIFDAWKDIIVPGGYIVFTGTEYAACGARLMADYTGWKQVDIDGQQVVSVLQKPTPKRAVFFICIGDNYVDEARFCAKSVKENMPSADCFLFSNRWDYQGFDHCVGLKARQSRSWYLDNTRYIQWVYKYLIQQGYSEMLLLDCDTYVCRPCDDIWYILQEADLAFGHSADRDNVRSIYGAPAAFTCPMIGVNLFKASEPCDEIIATWVNLYAANEGYYNGKDVSGNDQLAFRDALWKNKEGARYVVLPPEYACRHNFGVWVKGMVRIIHGRLPFMDKDLAWASRDINDDHTMRLWHPRWGKLWSVDKERAGEMG